MDSIFKYFVDRNIQNDKQLAYAYWFVNAFPRTEFKNEDLIFYSFMSYCTTLNVPLKEKYFSVYMATELRKILKEDDIHITGTETLSYEDPSTFENAVSITTEVMNDNIRVLASMDMNIEDFVFDMKVYMSEKRKERITSIMSKTFEDMQNSDNTSNAIDYLMNDTDLVRSIYDDDVVDELADTKSEDEQMHQVAMFGLPAIDKDSDGIWTKQLVGIEAQPGTGKTRFAVNILYNAVVHNKTNSLFITLEQAKEEIEAMFLSKHVYTLYGVIVPSNLIKRHKIPEEVKTQVEAAKIDLFESNKYGKLHIAEDSLYVENFIQELKTYDRLYGPFDLIAIDYMGLLESRGAAFQREKSLYDIVKSGFRQFKKYVRKSNKAGIAISQFNREGIEAGNKDKEITTDMAEGGIAVYKNTDFNIAISMNESMRSQNRRRFSQPKVRDSKGFASIIVHVRLEMCYFEQVNVTDN